VNIEEANALAREVDDRILALPEGLDPARLFGVRRRERRVVLVPFWSGVARELPPETRPPDECCAIAMESGGWSAPMDDDFPSLRPSQHPARRRMHSTVLVYGNGVDVTVLRCDDAEPQLLRGGVGLVLDLMLSCWARARAARTDSAPSG
jgi:hypothetical protein